MKRFYIWYVDSHRYSSIVFHVHEDAVAWSLKTPLKNLVITKNKTILFSTVK